MDCWRSCGRRTDTGVQQLNVTSIPDVLLFHKGQLADRLVGNVSMEQISAFMEKARNLAE